MLDAAGSTSIPGVALDDAGRLVSDLRCVKCDYNLRTLVRDAACPECGTAVGRSIEGNRLRYCDPAWLKQVWEGLNCFGAAVVSAIVFVVIAPLLNGVSDAWLALIIAPICAALGLCIYGFFKATAPDPARIDVERFWSPRKIAQWSWLAALAIVLLGIVAQGLIGDEAVMSALGVTFAVAIVLGVVALLAHAAGLAARLPNRPLVIVVIMVDGCFVLANLMVALLVWEWFWGVVWDWSMANGHGYRFIDMRQDLARWTIGVWALLAALLVALLIWYWWALSRAARHAWATWAGRKGEGD